jgi:hypothetical protein
VNNVLNVTVIVTSTRRVTLTFLGQPRDHPLFPHDASASSKIMFSPAYDRAYLDGSTLHCNTANIVTNATGGLLIDWELSIESTPFQPTVRASFPFLVLHSIFFYCRQHGNSCPLPSLHTSQDGRESVGHALIALLCVTTYIYTGLQFGS